MCFGIGHSSFVDFSTIDLNLYKLPSTFSINTSQFQKRQFVCESGFVPYDKVVFGDASEQSDLEEAKSSRPVTAQQKNGKKNTALQQYEYQDGRTNYIAAN